MATLDKVFTDIANSIRGKTGKANKMTPEQMPAEINKIAGSTPGMKNLKISAMSYDFFGVKKYNDPLQIDQDNLFMSNSQEAKGYLTKKINNLSIYIHGYNIDTPTEPSYPFNSIAPIQFTNESSSIQYLNFVKEGFIKSGNITEEDWLNKLRYKLSFNLDIELEPAYAHNEHLEPGNYLLNLAIHGPSNTAFIIAQIPLTVSTRDTLKITDYRIELKDTFEQQYLNGLNRTRAFVKDSFDDADYAQLYIMIEFYLTPMA